MNPGATTLPPASIVADRSARRPAPGTRLPTATILPSRTPTDPLTDGPPVPSMIRALVMSEVEQGRGLLRGRQDRQRGGAEESEQEPFHGRIISLARRTRYSTDEPVDHAQVVVASFFFDYRAHAADTGRA